MDKQNLILNGINIAYHKSGKGKQNLLCLHGNSLSSDIFIHQLNAEALQKEFTIYALDLPGYGGSDRSDHPEVDYTVQGQTKRIIEFCQVLEIKSPVIIGHSLGGNMAIEVIKKITDCPCLILAASPPVQKPMNPQMYLPHPAVPLFFQPDLDKESAEVISSALLNNHQASINLAEIILKSDPQTRLQIYNSISSGNYKDQVKSLKEYDGSIVICLGDSDRLVNPDYLHSLGLNMWKNKIQTIPNSGHLPFYENPEAFNTLLLDLTNQSS